MDLFAQLKGLGSAKKVSNVRPEVGDKPLNFVFFLCTKISGYRLNKARTGLTTTFQDGVRDSTFERIALVKNFLAEFQRLEIPCTIQGIMASKEAIALFPIPLCEPDIPNKIDGVPVMSDYSLLLGDLSRFGALYESKPWRDDNIPQGFIEQEKQVLSEILDKTMPKNIIEDFIERVFAEYALEGLWLQEGKFGNNPIALGVETQATLVLQNAALPKTSWIPSIQLK